MAEETQSHVEQVKVKDSVWVVGEAAEEVERIEAEAEKNRSFVVNKNTKYIIPSSYTF